MKKSFLKRAMAAAIAVPVALTQTALCVAFAEEAPAVNVTVDSFLYVPEDGASAKLVSSTDTERVYEQYSIWNTIMYNAVNKMAGKTAVIPGSELAEVIEAGDNLYKSILKNMIASNEAVVEVDKAANTITITVNVNYDSSEDVSALLSKKLGEDVYVETGVFDGEVVLTIDTEKLNESTEVPYSVTVITTEDGEMDFSAYVKQELEYMEQRFSVLEPEVADKIMNLAKKAADKITNANKICKSVSYTGANCDDIIAQVKADIEGKDYEGKKYVDEYVDMDKIPDTVDEVLDKSIVAKVLTKAVAAVSEKTDGDITVDVTVDDLAAVAESITEVTVAGSLNNGVAEGSLSGTLVDTADLSALRTYFENIEKANDLEIVTFDVVKVVDASATGNMNSLDGSAKLDIKRVITYTVKEIEEEEPTTDPDEPTSDPDEPTSDPDEPTSDPDEPTSDPDEPTSDPDEPTSDPDEPTSDPDEPTSEDPREDPDKVDDVVIVGDSLNYFFSHDETVLNPEELIETAVLKVEDEEINVIDQISFGLDAEGPVADLTPVMVYEAVGAAYVAMPVYVYYTPLNSDEAILVEDANVTIYVGVKGDANLNGEANAIDAAIVLGYAADRGAGEDVALYPADAALEGLAYFLADVDGESRVCGADGSDLNALDAAGILGFAAYVGANPGTPVADVWEMILGVKTV